jgi:hypothetical protein
MRNNGPGSFLKAYPVTGQNITQQIATINGTLCQVSLETKECNELRMRDAALQHFLPSHCFMYRVTFFSYTLHFCKNFEIDKHFLTF